MDFVRTSIRRRRAARTGGRGFSLLEALISAGVLGIALVGLVQMHATSMKGTAKAEDIGRAAELARQYADQYASLPVTALPACGGIGFVMDPTIPNGCRATLGPGPGMQAPKPNNCTVLVPSDATPDASGNLPSAAGDGNPYRVDLMMAQHPTGATGLMQMHVWVCWRDADGLVNEVHTTRTRVAGMW